MHYYKRNIGDYHKKAGRLTMLQHGAYTLLIDSCYDREIFPTVDEAIDWVWASSEVEVDAVKFVLKKFFSEDHGVFIQNRIQEDLDRYHQTGRTNKRIALEREAKRRGKSTKRTRPVNEPGTISERTVNEAPPNQEPRTINQEPLTKNQSKDLSAKANLAFDIFKYWCEVMGKSISTSKLTPKRDKAIKARIKEGYTIKQIKEAIDGCRADPFSMGQNDRQKPFNDIELICRNGEKLESFLDEIVVSKQRNINDIGKDFSPPPGFTSINYDLDGNEIP